MSVSYKGIKLDKPRNRSKILIALILIVEAIFTLFLYLSIAGKVLEMPEVQSAAGIPKLISYQGILTDSSGNRLGGAGATYCFRYSIYDAVSSGNKLWPSGTPTTATTTVTDGVFSDKIGRMDTLTHDFFSTSTVYLNVEVNTVTSTCSGSWESLSPREQITAAGFAISSANVYGDALRTPTSTKVQVGSGAGVTSGQVLLSLDVKNTSDTIGGSCTDNGAIWYNSANTRALVCEGGLIQTISNASSTNLTAIGVNSSNVSVGTVVFSNSNNVTFGLNGSTVTASAGGGEGAYTARTYQNRQLGASTHLAPGQNSVWLAPFRVNAPIDASSLMVMETITGTVTSAVTAQFGQTLEFGIYSQNPTNSTRFDSWWTTQMTGLIWNSGTSSASYNWGGLTGSAANSNIIVTSVFGMRLITVPIGSILDTGLYIYALRQSTSSANYSALIRSYNLVFDNPVPSGKGFVGVATNTSVGYNDGGIWTATTAALPSSLAITAIKQRSDQMPYFKIGNL